MAARSTSDAVPAGYTELLEQLKARVRAAQLRAARAANAEVLALYWSVGRDIVDRQDLAGWGARVVDRLASDLRSAFPDQRGWSRRNLQYMRAVAVAWPTLEEFVQQAAAQLPWAHVLVLLDRLNSADDRTWYARQALEHGWSRAVLEHQIAGQLRHRVGAAPSNFPDQLPPLDSELAQQLLRDPYVFDHLTLTGPVADTTLSRPSWTGSRPHCWRSGTAWPSSAGRSASTSTATNWSSTCSCSTSSSCATSSSN